MSSNDKRDLTTKASDGSVFSCSLSQYDNQTDCESNGGTWAATGKGKAAGATVTGDVVTLPPDSDDIIFTTTCDDSVSGVIDAELEMSYDKENWCPAVSEKFAAGTSTTGWGNSSYLETIHPTDAKTKHGKGKEAYDTSGNTGGSDRDVLYQFMDKEKPFNFSWWHKSETQPSNTYNPIIFRHGNKDPFVNEKYLNLLPDGTATTPEKKNKHLHAPANIGGNGTLKSIKFNNPIATNLNEMLWEVGPPGEETSWYKNHFVKYMRYIKCADETWDTATENVTDDTTVASKWTLNIWFKFEEDLSTDSSYCLMNGFGGLYATNTGVVTFSNNWGVGHNNLGDESVEETNLMVGGGKGGGNVIYYDLVWLKNTHSIDIYDKEWHLITVSYDSTANNSAPVSTQNNPNNIPGIGYNSSGSNSTQYFYPDLKGTNHLPAGQTEGEMKTYIDGVKLDQVVQWAGNGSERKVQNGNGDPTGGTASTTVPSRKGAYTYRSGTKTPEYEISFNRNAQEGNAVAADKLGFQDVDDYARLEGHVLGFGARSLNLHDPNMEFPGSIADASLYNINFSSDDVEEYYNDGKLKLATDHTKSSNLKVWYRFGAGDDGSGTDDSTSKVFNMAPNKDYASVLYGGDPDNHISFPDYDPPTSVDTLTSADSIVEVPKDIFHSKMGADKPFTINKWFKSSTQPTATDYSPVLFNNGAKKSITNWENTQHFKFAGTNTSGDGYGVLKIPDTNSIFHRTTGNGFTLSFWIRASVSGLSYYNIFGWGTRRAIWYGSSNGLYVAFGGNAITEIDVNDGEWHHVVLAYTPNDGTNGDTAYSWNWNHSNDATTASNCGWDIYVNGAIPSITFPGDQSDSYASLGDLYFGNYQYYSGFEDGNIDEIAVFNEVKDLSWATAAYNSGVPTDLNANNDSTLKYYLRATDNAGAIAGSSTTVANSSTASDASSYVASCEVASQLTVESSSSAGDIYVAPSTTDKFGNGLTASFTKKVVTSPWGNTKVWSNAGNSWNSTGAQGLKTRGIAGDNSETPLIRGDRDWTLSFWMKTTANNSNCFMGTTDAAGSGTGWEDQFALIHDNSWMNFVFRDSNGDNTYGKRIRYSGVTNMDGTPWDDEWHFYVLTFNANGNSTANADFEFMPTSSPDSTRSLTFYIDGQVSGVAGNTTIGTVSDSAITDGNKDWHWFSRISTPDRAAAGKFNQLAVFDEYMTASEVAAMYDGTAGTKGGNPTQVSAKSSCKICLEFETESYSTSDTTNVEFVNSAYSGTWANDSYRTDKSDADAIGAEIVTLTSSDDTYMAATVVNTFDSTASQGTSLLLSLDGFESDADAWVSYPVGSLLDGNWHNMQITYTPPGSFSEGDNITYGDSAEGNNNLKVYVDGEWVASNGSKGGSSTFAGYDKHFKYTTGTFVPGTFGASGWKETSSSTDYAYAFQGALDNLSLHSEVTDLTKAKEFYGKDGTWEGKPHNYQMSNSLTYANVEGWWTFDETGDFTSGTANDRTSNNIDLTLKYFQSDGYNLTSTTGQSIELGNRVKGEGFTVSITKRLKSDGTWSANQDQSDAYLVLSFNGFEKDAEHWVAYKTSQTLSGGSVDILDGRWHNVVISYQGLGNATDGYTNNTYDLPNNEIRYGSTEIAGDAQPFHFVVTYDGMTLESVGSGSQGFDLSKGDEVGFVLENKHLKHINTAATYIPTTYLASGVVEGDGGDSIYAFQGGFDESSFHSNNWWDVSNTPTPLNYNQEKPLTIFGESTGVPTEFRDRKKPYNLRKPSEAGVTTNTQDQYINPDPYDASTNPGGGLEVYYRWGDTLNDCSSSVKDVKGHETAPAVTDRDCTMHNIFHTDVKSLATSDSGSGTLYSRDITDNGVTMYAVAVTETTAAGLQTLPVKISGCAGGSCQQYILKGPKLQHMRVKWKGEGSCDLGEDKCRAQIWFRRRKK